MNTGRLLQLVVLLRYTLSDFIELGVLLTAVSASIELCDIMKA